MHITNYKESIAAFALVLQWHCYATDREKVSKCINGNERNRGKRQNRLKIGINM